jgi:hypothetical protein
MVVPLVSIDSAEKPGKRVIVVSSLSVPTEAIAMDGRNRRENETARAVAAAMDGRRF